MHIHHKIKPEHMNVKGIIIEVATIVFAVLFALGVESWWEHHKTMQMVEMSMERINKEVANNLYEFIRTEKSSTIKFKKLLQLENEIKNNVPFSEMAAEFNGYEAITTNSSTWKRVLNDKIAAYFPVDFFEDAFEIYNSITSLDMLKGSLVQFVFSDLYLNKEKEKEAFELSKLYYGQLFNHCKGAIKNHEEFLKKYDPLNFEVIKTKCDSIRVLKD
jgi:hypothetical protein